MKKLTLFGTGLFMTACLTMSTTRIHAQKPDEMTTQNATNPETGDYFHQPGDNSTAVTASIQDGDKNPKIKMRTPVKQNRTRRAPHRTSGNDDRDDMKHIMDNMKVFVGKWIMDGVPTINPSRGGEVNSAEFALWETPTGLEQTSSFAFTYKGETLDSPTDYEYFIPDYYTNSMLYLSVQKNPAGKTYTRTGVITSTKPNSFTVTVMYKNIPEAIQNESTVTLENGKWHQVEKHYDREGKQTSISTIDMRRQ